MVESRLFNFFIFPCVGGRSGVSEAGGSEGTKRTLNLVVLERKGGGGMWRY